MYQSIIITHKFLSINKTYNQYLRNHVSADALIITINIFLWVDTSRETITYNTFIIVYIDVQLYYVQSYMYDYFAWCVISGRWASRLSEKIRSFLYCLIITIYYWLIIIFRKIFIVLLTFYLLLRKHDNYAQAISIFDDRRSSQIHKRREKS